MQVDDILKGITQENGITGDLIECQYINTPQQYLTYGSGFHTVHKDELYAQVLKLHFESKQVARDGPRRDHFLLPHCC